MDGGGGIIVQMCQKKKKKKEERGKKALRHKWRINIKVEEAIRAKLRVSPANLSAQIAVTGKSGYWSGELSERASGRNGSNKIQNERK